MLHAVRQKSGQILALLLKACTMTLSLRYVATAMAARI
jgi:hypothetical protein